MSKILTITEANYILEPHEIAIFDDYYILSKRGYMAYLRQTKSGFSKKYKKLSKDPRGKKVLIQIKYASKKVQFFRLNRLMAKHFMTDFDPKKYIGFLDRDKENFNIDNLFQYIGRELFYYEMHYDLLDDPTEKQIDYFQKLLDENELNINEIEENNPSFELINYD